MSVVNIPEHVIPYNKDNIAYSLDAHKKPLLIVQPGHHVVVETMNAFSQETTTEEELNNTINQGYHHPFTGPIFIEGAEQGMTIGVHIEQIELAPYAYTCISRSSGVLKGIFRDRNYKRIAVETDRFDCMGISFQTVPSVGGIGLADPNGTRNGATCDHGGNLDFKQMVPGSTVYLPTAFSGGLLYIGDLHARQGDGELSGIALESSGSVHLSVQLWADCIPCPIIDHPEGMMVVGYGETFDEAIRQAVRHAVGMIATHRQISESDAYILLGFAANLVVGHLTGRIKSVAVQLSHELLAISDILSHPL